MRNNEANLLSSNEKWINPERPMPVATAGALGVSKGQLLYILGGTYNGSISILQAYNPGTKVWSSPLNTPVPNITGGATVLVNSNMYILGASTQKFAVGNAAPVYGYYDLDKNTYTPIPAPPSVNSIFFPSAVFMDDRIYVSGGIGRDGLLSSQVFMLDYRSNTWYKGNFPLVEGAVNAAGGVGNGAMFMIGGSNGLYGPAVATSQASNSNNFYLMQKT